MLGTEGMMLCCAPPPQTSVAAGAGHGQREVPLLCSLCTPHFCTLPGTHGPTPSTHRSPIHSLGLNTAGREAVAPPKRSSAPQP